MPNGYTKADKTGFSDSTFPGRGRLGCYLCGKKLLDHPILRPCPFPTVSGLGIEQARIARLRGERVRVHPDYHKDRK